MNTMPAPKVNAAPVDKGMGTQSEVMAQGGGGGGNSTRMNTAALGGINTNLIGTHTAGITKSVAGIGKAQGDSAKIGQHLDTITSHVKSLQAHVKAIAAAAPAKAAYKRSGAISEADAGDMSHYDPNLGMGKK